MNNEVEKRIRNLEQKNNFLLLFVLVVIVTFVFTGFTNSQQDKTIQCNKLEVIDSTGNVVAYLGIDADGSRGLFINDEMNRLRVATIHDKNQSAFYTFDSSGTIRIGLSQFAHGGGGLALHGEKSKGATVLYHKGSGSLSFYDLNGKTTTRVPQKKK